MKKGIFYFFDVAVSNIQTFSKSYFFFFWTPKFAEQTDFFALQRNWEDLVEGKFLGRRSDTLGNCKACRDVTNPRIRWHLVISRGNSWIPVFIPQLKSMCNFWVEMGNYTKVATKCDQLCYLRFTASPPSHKPGLAIFPILVVETIGS